MDRKAKAVVCREWGQPVQVETITVEGPKRGEITLKIAACGVMAEYATMHVDNCVKIDKSVPMQNAALVGCAAVFGIGGVGLNAIQGCAMAGAEMIVAVDKNPKKLEMAKEFGATHTININEVEDAAKAVKKLTGGVDYAFECVGAGAVVEQAYKCLGRGGTAVVVGVADPKDNTSITTLTLPADERTLKGSWLGSARPQYDFPRIIGLYKAGKLKLDELVTRTYPIEDAAQAFDDMVAGKNARGVIVMEP